MFLGKCHIWSHYEKKKQNTKEPPRVPPRRWNQQLPHTLLFPHLMLCAKWKPQVGRGSVGRWGNTTDGCLPYQPWREGHLLGAGPQLWDGISLGTFRGNKGVAASCLIPHARPWIRRRPLWSCFQKGSVRSIRVIFLVLQLVRLLITAHVGLEFSCQLLVAVKLLGEVGEPAYLVIPSAAHAPTDCAAPGHGLSWSCYATMFCFPLISQEHAWQVTADLYHSKCISSVGQLIHPAVPCNLPVCTEHRATAHTGSRSSGNIS